MSQKTFKTFRDWAEGTHKSLTAAALDLGVSHQTASAWALFERYPRVGMLHDIKAKIGDALDWAQWERDFCQQHKHRAKRTNNR